MKYKTLDQVQNEALQDPEYRTAWDEEEEREHLQQTLKEWRMVAGLTSAQVAEKMGIKPPTISRMEKNATKMSYSSLLRYAHACGVSFKLQQK
ncbi:helix-turn-helix domain-containing protein [Yokenella regensburgei]|uniref:helix-turn-helix domain-containing protein n=1 Tax=Yokenella regensburgei TaxID=158877 RepID=UPI001432B237|nr:helix-turn-helix transcriptional regulator [Yokenella regensburgei]QIU91231.1 helix-turn-helix transcriptional regulator [Yokenella regensburgei]